MGERQVATAHNELEAMPPAMDAETEQGSRTQFTSKGTIPPPLSGEHAANGNAKAASASDQAFGAPADPAWLKQTGDSLVAARRRIQGDQLSLLADDKYSTLLFMFAKGVMGEYDKNWKLAKKSFEGQVQDHLDVAAKRRETGNFMMGLALGGLPQTKALKALNKILETKGQIEGGLAALNSGKSQFGAGSLRHQGAAPAEPSGPATAKAPDGTKVDWVALVDQLLGSKTAFNASIGGVTTVEHEYDALIEKFRGGEVTPGSADALRAEKLAAFNLPAPAGAFIEASDFLGDIQAALGGKSDKDIEREMAMQWIAELNIDQLDALDDITPYLNTLGVIGPNSGDNLNVDGGDKLYDGEEKKVWLKARARAEVQTLVGTHVEWLGGMRVGNTIKGSVRANGNIYGATAKAADNTKCFVDGASVTERPGGSVKVSKAQPTAGLQFMPSNIFESVDETKYLEHLRLGQFELVVAADGGNHDTSSGTVSRGADSE